MRKTKLKNYLQLGILLFGIALLLLNCEQEKMDEVKTTSKYSIKKIKHNQLLENQKISDKISEFRVLKEKNKVNNQARLIHSDEYDFTIDTDRAVYFENTETGYNSYSFYLERDSITTENLENLVLSLNDQGEYDAYIFTYGFSADEFKNLDQQTLESLETTITPLDTNLNFSNGTFSKVILVCVEVWEYVMVDPGDYGELVGAENAEEAQHDQAITNIYCYYTDNGGGGNPDGSTNGNNNTSGSNNSGQSPNGGNSSSSNSMGTSPSLPTLEENPTERECNKIKKLFEDNPDLRQALITLSGTVNQQNENGIFLDNNSSIIQSIPTGISGKLNINMNPSNRYTLIAHTHDASGTYSVFSWDDLATFAKLIRNGKLKVNKFVAVL